jgi:ABC-type transporter MlaC component
MKTSLIAATLLTASMASSVANAEESVLQSFVTNMVSNAVATTTYEIKADVYQAVANATYHFELSPQEVRGNGKVSVTDLVVATEPKGSATEEDAD